MIPVMLREVGGKKRRGVLRKRHGGGGIEGGIFGEVGDLGEEGGGSGIFGPSVAEIGLLVVVEFCFFAIDCFVFSDRYILFDIKS